MDYKAVLEEQIRELQKVQDVVMKKVHSICVEDLMVATKVAQTIKDLVLSANMFTDK